MEIVKYIFAVLLTVPVAVIGLMMWSHFVDTSVLNKHPEKSRREDIEGFTVKMPVAQDTGDDFDF